MQWIKDKEPDFKELEIMASLYSTLENLGVVEFFEVTASKTNRPLLYGCPCCGDYDDNAEVMDLEFRITVNKQQFYYDAEYEVY